MVLLVSLLAFIPKNEIKAQEEKTMFIYNNGQLIAMFASSEVDSITFESDNQVIWMGEHVSKIPLAMIDSVEFVTILSPLMNCPDDNHPHLIDLGLKSGTMWACCNMGAQSPGEYGGYYAWGETSEKESYTWENCAFWYDKNGDGLVNVNEVNAPFNIKGTQYDVAHVRWGSPWCIPYQYQLKELGLLCAQETTIMNGIKGKMFSSNKTGGAIFIPYAGKSEYGTLHEIDESGYFWSSAPYYDWAYYAGGMTGCVDNVFVGKSVRPVYGVHRLFNELEMFVGESESVEMIVGSGIYYTENSAPEVATASISGDTVLVKALKAGEAVVKVIDSKYGTITTIQVKVTSNVCEAIDLGLPSGTKWASCNVRATKPEEYGGYYAWGETEERYKKGNRYRNISDSFDIGEDISETENDVAHVMWGDDWCIPTLDDFQELLNYCTSEKANRNGVNGLKLISKVNGNSIFFPAAGKFQDNQLLGDGELGYYWTSNRRPTVSDEAYYFEFYINDPLHFRSSYFNRSWGYSVRPICSTRLLPISKCSIEVFIGESKTISINRGSGSYTVESSDSKIAKATVSESMIEVTGIKKGEVIVTLKDLQSGLKANITVKVKKRAEAIDLGLPSGTMWASCNVGATNPEDYGGYFAWGETEEKEYYDNNSYKYYRYGSFLDIGSDISGTEYDVAHMEWGGDWHMPSRDDFIELRQNCTSEWMTLNGVNGCKYTSKVNGNSIFLPAAGTRQNGSISNEGKEGHYWSSTQNPYDSDQAYDPYFRSVGAYWGTSLRSIGKSVRPVICSTDDPSTFADLTLSVSSTIPIMVIVGELTFVEIVSGNGSYTTESNQENVASAFISDSRSIIVEGISVGTATITVTDTKSGETAIITVNVIDNDGFQNCPEAIDLGLPSGTKWANCNVGASMPEEYGGYYAWGETEEKEVYDWSTYIHCDGTEESCHDLGDISGTEYDVAHVKWGGDWCMPTYNEIEELFHNCTYERMMYNGVIGWKFTSKINGKCIFIPAAGYHWEGGLYIDDSYIRFWSSTPDPKRPYMAYEVDYYRREDSIEISVLYCFVGESVRPVVRK